MKTTVFAAFLMILAACECSAQYAFSWRMVPQTYLAVQSQQNTGVQPQASWGSGTFSDNQPNTQTQGGQSQASWGSGTFSNNQPNTQTQGGQSQASWGSGTFSNNQPNTQTQGGQSQASWGSGTLSNNQPTSQTQGGQSQITQRLSSNGAANEPIHNLAQPGSKPVATWVFTSDSRASEATTAGTYTRQRPIYNPSSTSYGEDPAPAVTSSRPKPFHNPSATVNSADPNKKAPSMSFAAAASEVHRKTSTSRLPSQQQDPGTASPVASSDKVVFYPPGGNTPGSLFNSLDTADADTIPDNSSDINNGLRQFALDLLLDMSERTPNKNVILSPYSIWAVMLVIFEGAEAQTAKQIATTLRFNEKKSKVRVNYKRLELALQRANNESHSDFVSGNGIFYDAMRPPLPDFQQFALSSYHCHLQGVDFSKTQQAVKIINDWVSGVTNQRIKTLVKAEDVMRPELIITNALFFKGQWATPFNLTATHTDKFYNEQRQVVSNVRMMYQKGKYLYSFINEIGAHVLDMPYVDSAFRMLVVLPKPSSTVTEVLRLMKLFPVDQCYKRLVQEQEMFSEDEVHVYLPKFKFGNRLELKSNLQRLGITDVFDPLKANLSSMSPLKLFLGKVFHVSEIEVNEEGTIASAATGAGFVNKMGPPKFLANRPFAYFIVENSQKTVIFAGKVVDPMKRG